MQAHPLSSTAARTSPPTSQLRHSPLTRAFLAHGPAANLPLNLPLPPTLLPPASKAAPLYPPVAEQMGLAHDAGNLLGALRLYADLLNAPGILRPEHRHYATDLHLIATRSAALIQRLLAGPAARHNTVASSSPDLTEAQAVHPATALRALAPVLERIAAGAAHVTVAVASNLPPVALPAEALERITVNLVRNAAEAIRSSRLAEGQAELPGHIRITLDAVAGAVRLMVEDDGPGMPPAVAAAFLRPGPLPIGAIRGLGHRIVHELATQTGAKLSIRVRPGRGTTFCLRWPHAEDLNPPTALEPLHRAEQAHGEGLASC